MTPHTPGPWAYHGVRVYAPAVVEQFGVRLEEDGAEVEHQRDLIALVYAPPAVTFTENAGARDANGHLIAAAPVLLETLHAVWRLVETLDIGIAEKAAIRDLVWPALDEARGPYPRVGTP
jgi:hypothetical protein